VSTEKRNACLKNSRAADETQGERVEVRRGGQLRLRHILDRFRFLPGFMRPKTASFLGRA
jgi:hypothetical protein